MTNFYWSVGTCEFNQNKYHKKWEVRRSQNYPPIPPRNILKQQTSFFPIDNCKFIAQFSRNWESRDELDKVSFYHSLWFLLHCARIWLLFYPWNWIYWMLYKNYWIYRMYWSLWILPGKHWEHWAQLTISQKKIYNFQFYCKYGNMKNMILLFLYLLSVSIHCLENVSSIYGCYGINKKISRYKSSTSLILKFSLWNVSFKKLFFFFYKRILKNNFKQMVDLWSKF